MFRVKATQAQLKKPSRERRLPFRVSLFAMPKSSLLSLLLGLCLLLHSAAGYYRFTKEIPNGHRVPNPCEKGTVWEGVGHQNPAGAGLRNPFGKDFAAAGYKWTSWLCRRDSDGDGRSNGDELGDPDCVWRVGAAPARTTGLSHPGLCPLGSTTCTNDWTVCPKKFDCPAFRDPDVYVRNFTLKETAVPPKVTEYMCQAFELNETATGVHMVGSLPIIRNKNVMHHMIMYACSGKPADDLFENPKSCFMGQNQCTEILNLWSYGIDGECFNEKAGVLVGGKGYRYAILELHWNNPEKIGTYKDSSGLALYFTKKLRQFNQGTAMYGEMNLALSPRQKMISYNQTCPGQCTASFHKETRYITSAMIHMHEYGVKGRVALWRNGSFVRDLVPAHDYDYNSPMTFSFDTPIEYYRGDEVKTECYFSTLKTNRSVFWGFETSEEMCFSFISFYPNDVDEPPVSKLSQCLTFGGINQCLIALGGPHVEAGCNVTALRSGEAAIAAATAMSKNQCYRTGCDPKCRDFLENTFWPSNACFDPKRSKSMAQAVGTIWYMTSGKNTAERQYIMEKTLLALQGQVECERELRMLEQLGKTDGSSTTSAAPTQPPTPSPPSGGGLSREHLLILLLVGCGLAFILGLLTLIILGIKILGSCTSRVDVRLAKKETEDFELNRVNRSEKS